MDYKAKYEEALKRAKEKRNEYLRLDKDNVVPTDIEYIFPELAESEDEDERMMRVIGLALTDVPEERFTSLGTTLKDCLAYLERQKGPQLTEEVKEWKKDLDRLLKERYGQNSSVWKSPIMTNEMLMEKQKEQKPVDDIESAAYNYADNFAGDYDDAIYNDIVDAYKAGVYYMELRQQEQKPAEGKYYSSPNCGTTAGVWSEEDEKMLQDVYDSLLLFQCDIRGDEKPDPELLDQVEKEKQWVKSLPKRLNPQPHWKPSEEQMNSLNYGIYVLEEEGYDASASEIKELYEQLKKLMED